MADENDNIIDNDQGPTRGGIWPRAREILRSQWMVGIVLAFIFAIVCAAVFLIGAITNWTFWFIFLCIPLIMLPTFFACLSTFFSVFMNGNQLKAGSFFGSFGSFFTRKYRSSFHFWRSLLWFILFYLVGSILMYLIAMLVCSSLDSGVYDAMITSVSNSSAATWSELKAEIGDEQYNMYMLYLAIQGLGTMIIGVLAFLYNICKNSLSVFYNITHPQVAPQTVFTLTSFTMRQSRGKYRSDLWKLVGPFLLVFLAGYLLVSILLTLYVPYFEGYYYVPAFIGLAAGFVALIFYMPFYFSGSVSFFEKWKDQYDKSGVDYNQMMYERATYQARMAEEQRRNMEEQMRRNGEFRDQDDHNNDSDNDYGGFDGGYNNPDDDYRDPGDDA
ncbi:MAG: hypothetical protein LUC31_00040 [Coprobacillus sp.]|nr:hypothetical protein [Coprobacillus sp.]